MSGHPASEHPAHERAGRLAFGFMCSPGSDPIDELEALPIDSLWVGGHVASPNPTPEAMMQLARLSAMTRRVRIGTAILLLPLYPPVVVAKQVADLDVASGGRVTLGVGVGGEYPKEFEACGVPIAERGSRTDEAIPLIRRLWSGEPVRHDGWYAAFDGVRIHPAPSRPGGPPIVVAGRQPVAMRRAARLGDGWMPYLYSARRYAESVVAIRQQAAENGRDLSRFEWFAFVFVNVAEHADSARRELASYLGVTYRQDFDAMVDRVAVAGSQAQVVDKLTAFADAGVRHFIFAVASREERSRRRIVDTLVGRIMPQLRGDSRSA